MILRDDINNNNINTDLFTTYLKFAKICYKYLFATCLYKTFAIYYKNRLTGHKNKCNFI